MKNKTLLSFHTFYFLTWGFSITCISEVFQMNINIDRRPHLACFFISKYFEWTCCFLWHNSIKKQLEKTNIILTGLKCILGFTSSVAHGISNSFIDDVMRQQLMHKSRDRFHRQKPSVVEFQVVLYLGFMAQSTQWGHVERGQFT